MFTGRLQAANGVFVQNRAAKPWSVPGLPPVYLRFTWGQKPLPLDPADQKLRPPLPPHLPPPLAVRLQNLPPLKLSPRHRPDLILL